MKKSYLLAGSLSLLGIVAGVNPAHATELGVTTETAKFDNLLAAQPENTEAAQALPIPGALADASTTIMSVDDLLSNEESMGQVTSVSQLSDVQPTDWAYQALASLVEKYGCIAGYPDGTFRGNRAATRFEMAAALNACLDVISDRFATKEELEALRKLMDEFAAELATLRGRVDNLEARTAALEATQFSTTTKLQGLAVISAQYGGALSGPTFNPSSADNFNPLLPTSSGLPLAVPTQLNPTVIAAVLLNLNTSFSGTDLLQTTLSTGNAGFDAISAYGVGGNPDLSGAVQSAASGFGQTGEPYFSPSQYYWSGFGTGVGLYRLAYSFMPMQDLTITAGPLFYPSDIIDTNSWANSPAYDFGTYFFINNPFIVPYAMNFGGGAGGAVQWNPNEGPFTVRALYMAGQGGRAISGTGAGANIVNRGGFAGDPQQGSVELEYANTFSGGRNSYAVKLQTTYSRTYGVEAIAGGLNYELNLGRFGLFGRGGIAGIPSNSISPLPYATAAGSTLPGVLSAAPTGMMAYTFMAGVGYKDLFVPGSVLAAAAGAPFINSASSTFGANTGTQINIEGFYRFPLSDNISITPMVTAILNPNNIANNTAFTSASPIIQGVIRTTFSF
ncbi:iron uptake porin [Candidatus Synechococcus calcipolaris G9]|uniref:Iron uptake porin n=1 Tax=Candidatus Synechococcus calcipolaris G9 TaxID=1497997 RepID=A0ABT6EUZ6_9SYNE|nr:iron uptake porin [Candidatus Synechococcus calcipolaris]MDG2989654.1 iron uptake porin [Candidatus Synechococcus calcipolaris G9]